MKFQLFVYSILLVLATIGLSANAGEATYSVPAPAKFNSVQTNKISDVTWKLSSGELYIKYPLPAELVGPGFRPIEIKGAVGKSRFVEMKGHKAHGFCMTAAGGGAPSCLVAYGPLGVEVKDVDSYLEMNYRDTDLELRKELARLFISDPAGELNIPSDLK